MGPAGKQLGVNALHHHTVREVVQVRQSNFLKYRSAIGDLAPIGMTYISCEVFLLAQDDLISVKLPCEFAVVLLRANFVRF